MLRTTLFSHQCNSSAKMLSSGVAASNWVVLTVVNAHQSVRLLSINSAMESSQYLGCMVDPRRSTAYLLPAGVFNRLACISEIAEGVDCCPDRERDSRIGPAHSMCTLVWTHFLTSRERSKLHPTLIVIVTQSVACEQT